MYEEVATKTSKFFVFKEVRTVDGKVIEDAKAASPRTPEQQSIVSANERGDRDTLKADSYIPTIMAVIYLLLFVYFRSKGGYRAVSISENSAS